MASFLEDPEVDKSPPGTCLPPHLLLLPRQPLHLLHLEDAHLRCFHVPPIPPLHRLPLPSMMPKRSQSVGRRRPATPRPMTPVPDSRHGNGGEISAAAKLLVTSTRSLSVSFQGGAFSLPISKTKAATPTLSIARKATPERRRSTPVRGNGDRGDQVENSKPSDQHRWPGRTRQSNSSSNPLSRSLDCSGDKKKLAGNGYGKVVRVLQQSMTDESRRAYFDGRLGLDLGNAELLKTAQQTPDANSANESSAPSDLTASDTDSVSSGSTSGVSDSSGVAKGRSAARGISVSARFWQETNSRLRRLQDPGSPLSTSAGSRAAASTKFIQSKRFSSDGSLSSPRTLAFPIRGVAHPATPSKLWASSTSSPSRGNASPARAEKCSCQLLKLADAIFMVQKRNAERHLWNAWVTTSELRHSVTLKRIKLVLLRQKLKLTSILKGQMPYLEEWALLDRDHSCSLLGATEALRASTLRLPVVQATADIQNLKDAVASAVDVMQSTASSICSLLSKFVQWLVDHKGISCNLQPLTFLLHRQADKKISVTMHCGGNSLFGGGTCKGDRKRKGYA
ncbi:QWRF motif-containing protein 2 [Quillaja saponaria]|uniref:QWRF motif-containing protein 2 n=1 Tax=Quillaja saponaria TaxID=32244 RepID=A0AAD7M0S7_QUISA|nr:QWRF motif-containing protein 2 [Quillaja saponaria]